jgi:hypothetical protein
MSFGFRLIIFLSAAIALQAQGNVIPEFECLDLLTRSGSTTLAASAVAGGLEIVVLQPIPLGARMVINPGASNEEIIYPSSVSGTGPYTHRLNGGWSSHADRSLQQAHNSGEPVVFDARSGSAYFTYYNLLTQPVLLQPGSFGNFFTTGDPVRGQPSSFAPGLNVLSLAMPHHPDRAVLWVLNDLATYVSEAPERRCGYVPPSVRVESLYLNPGTTRTNVRLGTASATYPTTFTASVPYVSRSGGSINDRAIITTDVTISSLRVDNGFIFGDITAAANAAGRYYTYALRAVNATGQAGIASNIIEVAAACPLTVTPSSLPNAFVNAPYSTALQASGATAPYRFALEASSLPLGLTLSETGVLSGTPQQTGTFPLNLVISSVTGCFHRTTMNLEILGQFCAANITPPSPGHPRRLPPELGHPPLAANRHPPQQHPVRHLRPGRLRAR